MSKIKKLKRHKSFKNVTNKNSSDLDEYLRLQAVVGEKAADSIVNKEFSKAEREQKAQLKPPKDEPPEMTLWRAFSNAKVVLNNDLEWKLFGFDGVPENIVSLEERAVRFSMFFCVLDYTIAQSEPVLKALDNEKYDEDVRPFLLESCKNPAHYMADYIERFQKAPVGQNPAGDYKNLLGKQIYDDGIPLDAFAGMFDKFEDFGRKFDRFRHVLIAAFLGAKDMNLKIFNDEFLNSGILTINLFEHFF